MQRAVFGVSAAIVPAILGLVAGSLKGERNLRGVLEGFEYSLSRQELDALIYVLPPYFALVSLVVLLSLLSEARSRLLGSIAGGLLMLATLVHTLGLARLVDRTPRDFPWELMSAVGASCVVAVVVLLILARKATDQRRWGAIVAAHAALLFPLSVSFIPVFDGHSVFAYATHWLAQLGLCAVSFHWMRRAAGTGWLPLSGWLRWLTAAMVLVGLFALPCWPALSVVRSRYEKHEECDDELRFGSLWQAEPGRDSVCPNTASYAFSSVVLLAAVAAALGCTLWARRSPSRA